MKQTTNIVLLIQPVAFKKNEETAINNYYQKDSSNIAKVVQEKALAEFNSLVKKLQKVGVKTIVVKDTKKPATPDSIFPNNWISFHNGKICIYPMFAKNRRGERREAILKSVENEGFKITEIIDYTSAEEECFFLEGTGSMVLDRTNRIAYCALSPRSNETLFIKFCEDLEYTPIVFRANQTVNGKRKPIYHTNVMMSIGEQFVLICLQTIDDKKQRKQVAETLQNSGKEIINLTEEQISQFAGNILQLKGAKNKNYIVMSTSAHKSLNKAQTNLLEKHGTIIKSDVSTIERNGGGSVRCMLAEVF